MKQTYKIIENKEQQQFQVILEDDVAYIAYEWKEDSLALMHTVVPQKHEGKGIASAMAKHVLDYAQNNNINVLAYCTYIKAYLKKHPEYDQIAMVRE